MRNMAQSVGGETDSTTPGLNTLFGNGDKPVKNNNQKLGSAGLALHYANVITQIDTLVTRSSSVPPNTRDALYQGLPPTIKSALRSKLLSFQLKEEHTVPKIKAEMEKTLQWLIPIATNTTKAHHGFGWVGEWANTGSDVNRKATGQVDLIRIETLHHADKEKTEAYILELVVWLHHLVTQSRAATNGGIRSPIKSPIRSPNQKMIQLSTHKSSSPSPTLTVEDQEMLRDVSKRKLTPGISKSQEFDTVKTRLSKHHRLSKSSSHSPTSETKKDPFPIRWPSSLPIINFDIDRIKALDVIDRVDTIRSANIELMLPCSCNLYWLGRRHKNSAKNPMNWRKNNKSLEQVTGVAKKPVTSLIRHDGYWAVGGIVNSSTETEIVVGLFQEVLLRKRKRLDEEMHVQSTP
ncbi:hypothetical protein TEA_007637 [Camellia sinensis var. sinensis]|uniref:DUF668 domain-containing protein n=1 Tax=Camellia sinensis var. sinensis TaxID=542762 RepID=A0A4V3WIV8_CAMSN|nr:hypothetical protein TEA_007637 [Camellia sinensis var. sinensis]